MIQSNYVCIFKSSLQLLDEEWVGERGAHVGVKVCVPATPPRCAESAGPSGSSNGRERVGEG